MEIAKKKALELVKKYSPILPYYSEKDNLSKAKQCAVVCVEEIKKSYERNFDFWDKVIKEIEKL